MAVLMSAMISFPDPSMGSPDHFWHLPISCGGGSHQVSWIEGWEVHQCPQGCAHVRQPRKEAGSSVVHILSLVFKAGFDAGFLFILYFIYHFDMPRIVKYPEKPCPKTVDCYNSRPTENKIFTFFNLYGHLFSLHLHVYLLDILSDYQDNL